LTTVSIADFASVVAAIASLASVVVTVHYGRYTERAKWRRENVLPLLTSLLERGEKQRGMANHQAAIGELSVETAREVRKNAFQNYIELRIAANSLRLVAGQKVVSCAAAFVAAHENMFNTLLDETDTMSSADRLTLYGELLGAATQADTSLVTASRADLDLDYSWNFWNRK
jgi:hypothetical protein